MNPTPPLASPAAFVTALAVVMFGAGGCATPGALHLYTIATAQTAVVRDTRGGAAADDAHDFLASGETLTGFAYDPFTDHFFLRLAPGDRVRVLDRPNRWIKREFIGEQLPAAGGGDLAVRPRDGHIFFVHPTEPALLELTRLGKFVRTLPLAPPSAVPTGVAYDAAHDRLLVLEGPRTIVTRDLDGRALGRVALDRAVGRSLAFDAETREFYASLAGEPAQVGVFDEQGRLVRTLPFAASFIDLGPRSFLRLF